MLDRCQVSESLTSIIPEPLLLTSPSLMSRDTETNPYKVSSELHSLICLKVVFTWNLWDDLSKLHAFVGISVNIQATAFS